MPLGHFRFYERAKNIPSKGKKQTWKMNEKGKPSFGFLIIVTAVFQKEQEIKILP